MSKLQISLHATVWCGASKNDTWYVRRLKCCVFLCCLSKRIERCVFLLKICHYYHCELQICTSNKCSQDLVKGTNWQTKSAIEKLSKEYTVSNLTMSILASAMLKAHFKLIMSLWNIPRTGVSEQHSHFFRLWVHVEQQPCLSRNYVYIPLICNS